MAIDYASPVGQVRLLATDLTEPFIFTDGAITAFLSLTNGNVKRAAALALTAIASDEVLVGKVVRVDDLQVSSHLVAEKLLKAAEELNAQADADDARSLNDEFQIIYDTDFTSVPEGVMPPVYGRVMGWERWR